MTIRFTLKRLIIYIIIAIVVLSIGIGARLYLDNRDGMTDISWEFFRVYYFSNGDTMTIINPVYYVEDGDFHYVMTEKGWTYRIRNSSYDYVLIYPDPEVSRPETFRF